MSDPLFVEHTFASIKSMLNDVMMYNPVQMESVSLAPFIIGRTQVRFAGLYDDMQFLAQFEEEEKRFHEAVKELEASEPQGQPE
jgi:hypothetical protein